MARNRWTGSRLLAGVLGLAVVGGSFVAGRISENDTNPRVLGEKVLPQVMFTEFRMICPFTHTSKHDPVVNPFPPGAPIPPPTAHDHDFFANPTTTWNSTLQTMLAAEGTCERKFGPDKNDKIAEPADRAGYWTMKTYFAGVEAANEGAIAWYSNPRACPSARVCNGIGVMPVNYTFPQDFRMIVGVGAATSPATNPAVASDNIFFNCYNGKGKTFGDDDVDGLNECAKLGGHRADIWMRFASCWVGRGGNPSWKRNAGGWVLDSPNHRDHVAYPTTAGCPASHPVVLPQLQVQIPFAVKPVGKPPANGSTMTLSSGKWWTAHFDFWNTWLEPRLVQLTAPEPPGA